MNQSSFVEACVMDYTARSRVDQDVQEDEENRNGRQWKKKRRATRKHRKPNRPATYMGQRSNTRKSRL
ncbi:MAG: hypothetical protein MK171_09800 [Pirellulales bacterium]|nr:hypothetical protein [Pirellulales bacterium]